MRRIPIPPKCLALLACESAAKDVASGPWSVQNIFDEMELASFPPAVPKLEVFLEVARGDADKETVYLALVSPGDQILIQSHIFIEWNNVPKTEYCQTFHTPIFRKPGKYVLRLFVEGHMLAERTIGIKLAQSV